MINFIVCGEGVGTFVLLVVGLVTAAIYHVVFVRWSRPSPTPTPSTTTAEPEVPWVPGAVPVLGHALRFQENPPLFLRQCQETVGCGVFGINLAGRRLVVIGSDETAHRQVSRTAETTLSARRAVAEIGFEYMLGQRSVTTGTDFHKRCLKDHVLSRLNDGTLDVPLVRELNCAMDWELERCVRHDVTSSNPPKTTESTNNEQVRIPDLFYFLRRCLLRTTLNVLVGSCILEPEQQQQGDGDAPQDPHGDALITQLMEFQEHIENATARGAVVPHWIAVPFVWNPVARARKRLQQQIANRIAAASRHVQPDSASRAWGPWLQTLKQQRQTNSMELDEISELIVGLIFAAHKNPAIGVAQSLCFLLSEATEAELQAATAEANTLLTQIRLLEHPTPSAPSPVMATFYYPTIQACVKETMRLTSHSIGSVRRAMRPFVLETNGTKYLIQKDTTVCESHILQTTDPKIWGDDALEYNPIRFLDSRHRIKNSNPSELFTAFSAGVHKCPGERLALRMMELALALLLERGAAWKCGAKMPPLSFERATLAQRQGPVPISVKRVSH